MVFKDAEIDSLLPPLKLNRRGFIATGVAAGFSLAAGPVAAQTAIKTDSKGLVAGRVDIPTTDGKMPAYRAAPEGRKGLATLLVVSEIFGVHEYIQDVCRRLAHQAISRSRPNSSPARRPRQVFRHRHAARPDHRQSARRPGHGRSGRHRHLGGGQWRRGRQAGHPGLLLGRPHCLALRRPSRRSVGRGGLVRPAGRRAQRAQAALGAGRGAQSAGAGAGRLWRQGRRHSADGRGQDAGGAGQGPAAAKASRIDVYPDAPHAFHADYRPSFHKAEAEQAWQRMLDWFKQNGL